MSKHWTVAVNNKPKSFDGGNPYLSDGKELKRWHLFSAVPSSLAGESVDLIEEDDGRSDGPRLPKHLRAAPATIGGEENRTDI